MKKTALLLLSLSALALPFSLQAQQMNYQGRLTDVNGAPRPGPQVSITFSLWDAPTGGAKVWGDFARNVDLIDGNFSLKLGDADGDDGNGNSLTDAFSGKRYLQVIVAGDAPLPRQEILYAPVAMTTPVVAGKNHRVGEEPFRLGHSITDPNLNPARSLVLKHTDENGATGGLLLNSEGARIFGNGSGSALEIYDFSEASEPNHTPKFRIRNDGFLSSDSGISVLGSIWCNGALRLGGNSTESFATLTSFRSHLVVSPQSGGTEPIVQLGKADSNTHVGINRAGVNNVAMIVKGGSPGDSLIDAQRSDGTYAFSMTDTRLSIWGSARKNDGSSAWSTFSDARLKKDVKGYAHGLDEILGLRTVRYRYKDDAERGLSSKKENIGFIAQEVQKVIPEAVSQDEEGFLSLSVDPIHWAVVNAIQELNSKIETQSKTITTVSAENASLKDRLDAMEARLDGLAASKAAEASVQSIAAEQ